MIHRFHADIAEADAIEPLAKDSVVDGNINNLDAVSDSLKRCHKRLGSGVRNLALALPNAAVISKKILVPAGQTEEELEVQVETEANQYIPFSLDEVNLELRDRMRTDAAVRHLSNVQDLRPPNGEFVPQSLGRVRALRTHSQFGALPGGQHH